MSYLQNGICYKNIQHAQNDFISRMNEPIARNFWINRFKTMSESELQAFFPECVSFQDYYLPFLISLLGLVCLILVMKYAKRATEI